MLSLELWSLGFCGKDDFSMSIDLIGQIRNSKDPSFERHTLYGGTCPGTKYKFSLELRA